MPNVMLYIVTYRQYIDEKKILVQNIPSFFQNKKICLFSCQIQLKTIHSFKNHIFLNGFLTKNVCWVIKNLL